MKWKVIGLDTAIQKTGFSVFVDGKYSRSGLLKPGKKVTGDEAFELEAKEILDLLELENPDFIAVETTYQKNNYQVYRRLSMLIGVVYGWAIAHNKYIASLEAKKWRSTINQDFAKMKREDAKVFSIKYVEDNFHIQVASDDEADAVLIGKA